MSRDTISASVRPESLTAHRSPRLTREARLRWLDAEIRAGHYPNAATMADTLAIARRTAWSDAAHLRDDLHAPLHFDDIRGGWHYTEPTFALPLLYLTGTDTAALRTSLLTALEFLGEDLAQPLRTVLESLDRPPSAIGTLDNPHVSVGGATHLAAAISTELREACTAAVRTRTKLTLRYHGAHRGATTERTVRPYHLHNDCGEWYLFAHCESRDALRTFHLGRIEQYQTEGDPAAYRIPRDFNADTLIRQGFHLQHGAEPVRVVVRFDAYQARWARERIYHPTQITEALPDGSLRLTWEVGGWEEIKRWLLGYGSHVEVLEPADLRQEIADEARRLQKIYD
jgi:predicted DNA-binding transcriptional regulator YafY